MNDAQGNFIPPEEDGNDYDQVTSLFFSPTWLSAFASDGHGKKTHGWRFPRRMRGDGCWRHSRQGRLRSRA